MRPTSPGERLSVDDERLSCLDTAFLRLESAGAPMHLGALAVFAPRRPIAAARLVKVLTERLARIPSLRQRIRTTWLPPGGAAWTPDKTFDLNRHLHLHKLDQDAEAMTLMAGELMAEPLDLSRPLWQVHLLTGLPEGRFAVLIKLHHAMADGLRTVELGLRLLDGFADRQPGQPDQGLAVPAFAVPFIPPIALPAAERATRTARAITELAQGAMQLPRALAQASSTMGIAASVLSHARLAALPSLLTKGNGAHRDPVAPTDQPAAARRLVLARLDTHDIRQVRKRHGGTEHDVLLAVITGALQHWALANGRSPQALTVRAFIPVSHRSHRAEPRRRNVLSGYLCDLPIHHDRPVSVLHDIRAAMDRNKAAGFARGPGAFPVLADRMPAAAQHLTIPLLRRAGPLLFDTTITSVPIPSRPMTFAGGQLQHVYPIAPLAHGQELAIAVSTYRDSVHIGLHADHHAVPDLERVADAIPAALATLNDSTAPAR
ncbi:wax ester/triacylglycerol synthase family O-acyltransferase [Dactylosporangium sp. NPDC048998]|uniref:wax ester/triacylglycerol synthase family O-acyltransferase n=1 Tax=Dactylosporangium sp. NPDC048998 TaxID=3363976 RepID=UPI0037187E06